MNFKFHSYYTDPLKEDISSSILSPPPPLYLSIKIDTYQTFILLMYIAILLSPVRSNADVRNFQISMTFRCERHLDARGSRCFKCVFIHERRDVCGTRRNGKVVKVITVVTKERYDDVALKEGK